MNKRNRERNNQAHQGQGTTGAFEFDATKPDGTPRTPSPVIASKAKQSRPPARSTAPGSPRPATASGLAAKGAPRNDGNESSSKALNQAVKRNIDRFPGDSMFQLSANEKDEVVTNCVHLAHLPSALRDDGPDESVSRTPTTSAVGAALPAIPRTPPRRAIAGKPALRGRFNHPRNIPGWTPRISFNELVAEMLKRQRIPASGDLRLESCYGS